MKKPSKEELLHFFSVEKDYHIVVDHGYLSHQYEGKDEAEKFQKFLKAGKFYRENMLIDLEQLAKSNKAFDFYGAHSNMFKLNTLVLEALEDPNDGYRSYFDSVVITTEEKNRPTGFFDKPIAKVKLEKIEEEIFEINNYGGRGIFSGWKLVDIVDKHVWLKFGTDYSTDYYPCFVFQYEPKMK